MGSDSTAMERGCGLRQHSNTGFNDPVVPVLSPVCSQVLSPASQHQLADTTQMPTANHSASHRRVQFSASAFERPPSAPGSRNEKDALAPGPGEDRSFHSEAKFDPITGVYNHVPQASPMQPWSAGYDST